MSKEEKKDFNAMLRRDNGMPKIQIVTDPGTIKKYGGEKMYFAPPSAYDEVMGRIPMGRLLTVGEIRSWFARKNGADFTDPITAGIFVSIAAWASEQRETDKRPYWRVLKAGGELNPKFPGGAQAQKEKLEAEGHVVLQKGGTNLRYYLKDYQKALFLLD